jgi:putative acyl-CoA dehydrogenase
VPTIIEMVNLTRLDCTLSSATSVRSGLARAIHHAQHRKAFGEYLIDQPLMRNVLADLGRAEQVAVGGPGQAVMPPICPPLTVRTWPWM